MQLIVVERLVKSAVLVVFAASLLAADRLGYLRTLADWARTELGLMAGHGLISRALTWLVDVLGHLLPQATVVAIAALVYAALEATEGVGLALRRRWAEYLTVLATGLFIPFEAAEVVQLHVFGGFSLEEAGSILGISRATAYRDWAFARAWLRDALISR